MNNWFLVEKEAEIAPNRYVYSSSGNQAQAFIDYEDYYRDLANVINTTQGMRNFILIVGWTFDPNTPVKYEIPNFKPQIIETTIGQVLKEASRRYVIIRAMIFAHPDGSNLESALWIAKLPFASVIHDDRTLLFGSHHQKMVIIGNNEGVFGYCGGMDIASDRLKREINGKLNESPWHDVQVKIKGNAAIELWKTFYERWQEQKELALGDRENLGKGFVETVPVPRFLQNTNNSRGLDIQIVRTYGNGSKNLGLNMNKNIGYSTAINPLKTNLFRFQSRAYRFAPNGETSIYKALLKAIKLTEKFIYLEDQYLVASAQISGYLNIAEELAKTIAKPSFVQMVILVPGAGTIQPELHQVWYRRIEFWKQLGYLNSKKVSIWAYNGAPGSPFWQHSKTWIFDDRFTIISSANCNRRSYSHDSEVGASIYDPYAAENLPFPHKLRIDLWLKHLNAKKTYVKYNDVVDFSNGLKLWQESTDTLLSKVDLDRPNFIPPDNSLVNSIIQQKKAINSSFESFIQQQIPYISYLKKKNQRDWEWDLIDPDGA